MTSLSDEADDPEPGVCPEKVEECIVESTTIDNSLSHKSGKMAMTRKSCAKWLLRWAYFATHHGRAVLMSFYGMTASFMRCKQPRGPVAPRCARLGYEDVLRTGARVQILFLGGGGFYILMP